MDALAVNLFSFEMNHSSSRMPLFSVICLQLQAFLVQTALRVFLDYFLGRWGSFTSSFMTGFNCPHHWGGMRPGGCRDCDLQNFLRRVKQEWSGKINDVTFHYLQRYPKAAKSASFQEEIEKLWKAKEAPPGAGNPTTPNSDTSDLSDLSGEGDLFSDSDSLEQRFFYRHKDLSGGWHWSLWM